MVYILNSLVEKNVRYYCATKGEKVIFTNMLPDSTIAVHALDSERGTLFVINSTETNLLTLIHEVSTILRCGLYSDCIFFEHFLLADYRSLQGITALRKHHRITARKCEPVNMDLWKELQKGEKKGKIELAGGSRLFINDGVHLYSEETFIHKTQSSSANNPNLHVKRSSLPATSNHLTQPLNKSTFNISKKIKPSSSSSSKNKNHKNPSCDEIFTQCSICQQKDSDDYKELLHILSCGHVLCVSCLHPVSNYIRAQSLAKNICPICDSMEPCFVFPSVTPNNISNCALHKDNRAKFYCEECVRFLCFEKECEFHPVVKIDEISMKNSILANELSSAGAYIQELSNIKDAAESSLSKLDQKSKEIKSKFQLIIDEAFERMREVQRAIQSEKAKIEKRVVEVSKKVEGAQRRIRLASHIYEITKNYFWTSNISMLKVYRLGASKVFRKALEMSKNVKRTSQSLQKIQLNFENEDWVQIIVEQLRTLFKNYVVSDGVNSESYEVPSQMKRILDPREQETSSNDPMPILPVESRITDSKSAETSRALRDALFSTQKTVPNKLNRPESQLIPPDRGETLNDETELVPRKRQKTVRLSSYSSMNPPIVNDHDSLMNAFLSTTYTQEPFTLLTTESQNLVVRAVEKMCEEERNRRKNMKTDGPDEKSIVGKQRIRINRLVLELYSKQDRGGYRDVKQETIKIEPPDMLDKEIKKEESFETSQIG